MSRQTITEFLEARIAEDERVARSASPGPWSYSDIASVAGGTIYDPTVAIASVGYDVDHVDSRIRRTRPDWQADATGRHIARHDPARVLAECAAKRAILDEYTGSPSTFQIVAHMAAVYSDHPDYQQEWAA